MSLTAGASTDVTSTDEQQVEARHLIPDRARLVLLSFLMLFVELALIRWSGSNVVYLAYFSNFVLLGSFLGIGLGFLRARPERATAVPARRRWRWRCSSLFIRFFPVDDQRVGRPSSSSSAT